MTRIFVAGHRGMVGTAMCRQLEKKTDVQLITRTRSELDLCDQTAVKDFFKNEKPDEVILAAAKVGGIHANNTYPAEFIYENIQIQNNVIHAAHLNNVQKLLFMGSSCIYPKLAVQPMNEDTLLTGPLEPTNEPYAIAKIAGIKMCESYNRQYGRDYRSVMPTNLYGPGDNYNKETSHVLPALIRRFHEAKINKSRNVVVWGTGKPMREFLYVDDMVKGSLLVHQLEAKQFKKYTNPMLSHINIGTGIDITIEELATTISDVVKFYGKIIFDPTKPDGSPRKLLNVQKIGHFGWIPQTSLRTGIELSYADFLKQQSNLRI